VVVTAFGIRNRQVSGSIPLVGSILLAKPSRLHSLM
jgi:hypothetical protein